MRYFSICCFLAVTFVSSTFAQTTALSFSPKIIGDSGASIALPEGKFDEATEFTADGSKQWAMSLEAEGLMFMCIHINIKDPIGDDATSNQDYLTDYLDYFKEQVGVTKNNGYVRNINLEGYKNVKGIRDSWEIGSDNGTAYAMMQSWVSSKYLTVLIIISPENKFSDSDTDRFFNSIVYPR